MLFVAYRTFLSANTGKISMDQIIMCSPEEEPEELSEGSLDYFIPADDEHISKEKRKARELRQSQWWKNELAKGLCHYCKKRFHPSELTMDHVVPIVRGGFSKKSNIVTCCKDCNNKKKYLLPTEWQEYMDKLSGKECQTDLPQDKEV